MSDTKRVLALGFFDGVHLGHGALLKRAVQVAESTGATAAVLTFDMHPEVMIVGSPTPLINSRRDREYLAKKYFGIDEIILSHFDEEFMHMPWTRFIEERVWRDCGAVHVVAGHDFHFGYRGSGNPQRLMEKCGELGIGCDIIPCVEHDGITVSSTYIRKLIAQGEIGRANEFLGHPHTLSAEVVHGRRLGHTIGIPTVNMRFEEGVLTPCHGVYATRVHLGGGQVLMGVTNVGVRPTVDGNGEVSVETNILDFEGDLYGEYVRVDFHMFIRPEMRFDGIEALKKQIEQDRGTTRSFFDNRKSTNSGQEMIDVIK